MCTYSLEQRMNKREGKLPDFERGVRCVMFGQREYTITEHSDPLVDAIRSYRRLQDSSKHHQSVSVELEISGEEVWIGVYCSEQELELYYCRNEFGECIYSAGKDIGNEKVHSAFGEICGFLDYSGDILPVSRVRNRLHRPAA